MSKQVDQLYFTWASSGFGDTTGFRLRAASEGVADIASPRYNTLKPFLGYFLPKGTDPDPAKATTEKSPLCLVYGQAGEEYVLAQKVYTGRDAYERTGVYFVHLLAGLPEEFVAQDAIQLWRPDDLQRAEKFWQYWSVATDPGQNLRYLQPFPIDVVKRASNTAIDEQMIYLLRESKPFLAQVIQAYLLLPETHKLFIAGTPQQVAALVWALTRSLPRTMQRDLTFSTYEQDVLKASVRVVGTCGPQTAQLRGYILPSQLLPVECARRGVLIDCEHRQVTGIQNVTNDFVEDAKKYAEYVVDCLLEQNISWKQVKRKELDELLKKAADVDDVKDTAGLLRYFNEGELYDDNNETPLEQRDVLACFQVSRYIQYLDKKKVPRFLIHYATTDPRWWNEQAKPLIERTDLSDTMQRGLRTLGKRVATELYRAMVQQETERWPMLQSILLTVTPPDRDNVPWIQLLKDLNKSLRQSDKLQFRWTTRFDLLTQWAVCYWTYDQEKEQREDEGQDIRLWNQPVDEQLIFSWLELHSWDEFKAICDFIEKERKQKAKDNKKKAREQQAQEYDVFPHKWLQLAFINLLMRPDEKVIPNWLPAVFDPQAHYTYLMGALIHMMQFPKQQPAVLLCFSKLAKRHYPHIPLILAMLISAGSLSHKLEEQFFAVAGLNSQQKNELLEKYLIHILPDNPTPAVPKVVEIVCDYLDKLTLERLNGEEFPVICETLKLLHNRQVKLPPEVTLQVKYWIRICHSIATFHPFFLSGKSSFELDSVSLTTLNEAIVGLSLPGKDKHFKIYKEELLFILINQIADYNSLRDVLEYLYPALTNESWQALLKELVAYFGRSYTPHVPYGRFIPYIDMALLLYRKQQPKPKTESKRFWDSYLQPLFRNVDSKTLALIDRVISNGPNAFEWGLFINQYKPYRKRFTRAGEIVAGAKAVGSNMANVAVAAANFAGTATQGLQGVIQTHLSGQSLKQGQTQPASSGQNDSGRQAIDQQEDEQAGQVDQSRDPNQQDNQLNAASGQYQSPGPGVHPQDATLNGGYNSALDMNAQNFQYHAQGRQGDYIPQNVQVGDAGTPKQPLQQPNGQVVSSSSGNPHSPNLSQPPLGLGNYSISHNTLAGTVSTVNGQPISLEYMLMVYNLKDIYIRVRLAELNNLYNEESAKGWDVAWIDDERSDLQGCLSPEGILRILENDILIIPALEQYDKATHAPELDLNSYVEHVLKQQIKSQSDYVSVLGNYSDDHMRQVLLIFLRYRALSYFFRKRQIAVLTEWLERQRSQVKIQPNEELLRQQGAR